MSLQVFLMTLAIGMSMAAMATDRLKYMSKAEHVPIVRGWPWKGMPWKSVNASAPPKRCCTPDQWEGTISGFMSFQKHFFYRPELVYELVEVSFDATNKRLAGTAKISGDEKTSYRVIELYDENKIFVIDSTGKCRTKALEAEFKPLCIPESATFVAHYTQGLGEELIEGNAWMSEYRGFNNIFDVTSKQCIPLSDTFWGKTEGWTMPTFGVLGYLDITAGIKSPAVFTPPKDCTTVKGDLWDEMGGVIKYIHKKISDW